MSRVLSVLVFLCSILSTGLVYAQEPVSPWSWSITPTQSQSIALLDKLEAKTEKLLDTVGATTTDIKKDLRIEKKQQEIELLINEAQADIKDTTSSAEIKEIVEETKKTIELKQSSALTDYGTLKEWLKEQGITSKAEIAKAEKVLKSAIIGSESITIQIKTSQSLEAVQTKLLTYDENLQIILLFNEDGFNYIELTISNESLLKQELFGTVNNGELPDLVLGYEVIKPQVFKIEQVGTQLTAFAQETSNLRGWKSFGLAGFQAGLASKIGTTRVKVGVIDTGIDPYHPDLQANVSQTLGYDFINDDSNPSDDQWHGTHVAGTIGAIADGNGIVWINPNVELVPLKICDAWGYCSSVAILNAIAYAKQNNVKILNMSLWGRISPVGNATCEAIEDFVGNGWIVVAAAGNSNTDTSTFVPWGCPYAITVAAIDEQNNRASFSNYGAKVDVAAPGVGIYSSTLGNGYKSMNGTSMATPHIVGLISLMKAINNNLTTAQIKQLFKQYILPVTTDPSKPIASAVDVSALLGSLWVSGSVVFDTWNQLGPVSTGTTNVLGVGPILIKSDLINKPLVADIPVLTDEQWEEQIMIMDSEAGINTLIDPRDMITIQEVEEVASSSGLTIQRVLQKLKYIPSFGQSPFFVWSTTSVPLDYSYWNNTAISDNKSIVETLMINAAYLRFYANKAWSADVNVYSWWSYKETYVVTVTDAPPVKKLVLSPSSMTLEVGQVGYISALDGTGPYAPRNGNGEALEAGWLTQWQYWVRWLSPWTAVFSVRDIYGKTADMIIKVVARPLNTKEIDANLSVTSINQWGTTELTITDGNGGYNVSEVLGPLLQITRKYSTSDMVRVIKWMSAGIANINITDSKNRTKTLTISISQIPSELVLNATDITLLPWASFRLFVLKGNGKYKIAWNNGHIAQVKGTNFDSWIISGAQIGVTSLEVSDDKGKKAMVKITVKSPTPEPIKELVLSATGIIIASGWSARLNILSGNEGYHFTYTPGAIKVTQSTTSLWVKVEALKVGKGSITITDAKWKNKIVPVTVISPITTTKELVLNTSSITVNPWSTTEFTITDGNGVYNVSYDTSILQVNKKISTSDTVRTVKGLKSGTTTLTVSDSKGKSKQIVVTVKSIVAPLAKITSYSFYTVVPEWWVWQGYFEATGLIMGAWVEYYDPANPGAVYTYTLDLQKTHQYMIFYNRNCSDGSKTCRMNMRPYVIDVAGSVSYLPDNRILTAYYGGVVINSLGEWGEESEEEFTEYLDETPLILPENIPQVLIDKQTSAMAEAEANTLQTGEQERVEINALQNMQPSFVQRRQPLKYLSFDKLITTNTGRLYWTTDAIAERIEELQSTSNLSSSWFKNLGKEIMVLINYGSNNTSIDTKIQNIRWSMPSVHAFLSGMKAVTIPKLLGYDKNYYYAYLGAQVTIITLNPSRFNATNLLSSLQAKFAKIGQTQQVKVSIIRSVPTSLENHVWQLHFKIYGIGVADLSEVWVQFTNGSGQIERESLELEEDGEYMAGYSRVTCVWCSNFKPYIIRKWSTIASFGDIVEQGGLEIGDAVSDATDLAKMTATWINLGLDKVLKEIGKKTTSIKNLTTFTKPKILKKSDATASQPWWIHFKIEWVTKSQLSQVWVKFTNNAWVKEKQTLALQDDGEYIIWYSNKTCPWCTNFEPYFVVKWWISISSVIDGIETASSSSQQFAVDVKNIFLWRWYDATLPSQAQQKVLDIRQDYGAYASITIGFVDYYGIWPVYDITSVILWFDPFSTLPLSPTDRLLTFIGGVAPGVWWAALVRGKTIMQEVALKYGVEIAEVLKLSDEFATLQYNLKTIQDVVDKKALLTLERFEQDIGNTVGAYKASKIINTYDWVANYLKQYGKLPNNYITKSQAQALGWSPWADLSSYAPGKSIGGDVYKNLTEPKIPIPDQVWRIWYEADIWYVNGLRWSDRIVYSNDWLIFKSNHYQDWTQIP